MSDSATPWIAARQASLSITNSRSSLTLKSIESVMPSSHLILWRPLLLLPPIPPSISLFPMSQLFAWGGQSTGVSASASFPPKPECKILGFNNIWVIVRGLQYSSMYFEVVKASRSLPWYLWETSWCGILLKLLETSSFALNGCGSH